MLFQFSYALYAFLISSVLATGYQHLLDNENPSLTDGYWVRTLPAFKLPSPGSKDERLLDAFRFRNRDDNRDDASSGVRLVSHLKLVRDSAGNLQRPPISDGHAPGVFMIHGKYNSLTELPGDIPLEGYFGRSLAIFAPHLAGENMNEIIEIKHLEGIWFVRFLSAEEIEQQKFRTVQDQERLPALVEHQDKHPIVRTTRKRQDRVAKPPRRKYTWRGRVS